MEFQSGAGFKSIFIKRSSGVNGANLLYGSGGHNEGLEPSLSLISVLILNIDL